MIEMFLPKSLLVDMKRKKLEWPLKSTQDFESSMCITALIEVFKVVD